MLERTGCDAIMISRGVLGNPWIFRQILVPGTPQPTVAEWRDVLMRHLAYHRDHYGDGKFDIIPFRKHLLWYTSGFPGMRRLREELNTVDHPDRIVELVDTCLDRLDPATRRYEANREPMAEDAMSARYRSAGTPAGKSAQVVS